MSISYGKGDLITYSNLKKAKKIFCPHIEWASAVKHYEGRLKDKSMDLEQAYDKIYRYAYFKLHA